MPHTWHWYTISSLWTRRWDTSWPDVANRLLQTVQLNGFSQNEFVYAVAEIHSSKSIYHTHRTCTCCCVRPCVSSSNGGAGTPCRTDHNDAQRPSYGRVGDRTKSKSVKTTCCTLCIHMASLQCESSGESAIFQQTWTTYHTLHSSKVFRQCAIAYEPLSQIFGGNVCHTLSTDTALPSYVCSGVESSVLLF